MRFSTLSRRAGLQILAYAGVTVVAVGAYAVSAHAAAPHPGSHGHVRSGAGRAGTASAAATIVGEWHDSYGTIVITQTGTKTYTDTAVTPLQLSGGSKCTIPAGTSQGTITGKGDSYTGWLTTYSSGSTATCTNDGGASFGLTLSGSQLTRAARSGPGSVWP